MRKILFLIFSLLLTKNGFSQNQIEIYRLGLTGAMNLEQEHPDTAEKYLLKALAIMPDKSIFPYYFPLIKIAYNHNDTKKITGYFRELSVFTQRIHCTSY